MCVVILSVMKDDNYVCPRNMISDLTIYTVWFFKKNITFYAQRIKFKVFCIFIYDQWVLTFTKIWQWFIKPQASFLQYNLINTCGKKILKKNLIWVFNVIFYSTSMRHSVGIKSINIVKAHHQTWRIV